MSPKPAAVVKRLPRDVQKSKLYRAERSVFGKGPLQNHVEELTLQESVDYVARIWADPWFNQAFPRRIKRLSGKPPDVVDGRGTRSARGSWSYINLPRWARNHCVILHEIAHAAKPGGAYEAAHGREFAARFLALIQHYLGVEAARRLKVAFRAHHVRYTPKKKLTPAVLAKLRARGRELAAARKKP